MTTSRNTLMSIEIQPFEPIMRRDVCRLVQQVFDEADGEDEGRAISELVAQLVDKTDPQDLHAFVSRHGGEIVATVFFSRLSLPGKTSMFLLSPMAVATRCQQQGVGSALIRHGLQTLWDNGIELVVTYGDPAYYGRFGFKQISTSTLCPPWPLSQPIGWQAASASGLDIAPLQGRTTCVAAFNDPVYW